MRLLSAVLVDYAREYLMRRLQQGQGARIQPVLVGPPADCLGLMYDAVTANDTVDWSIEPNLPSVVVLLIDARQTPGGRSAPPPTSARCGWDYAVSVRNSALVSLTLVAPAAWESRSESVANATETLGQPGGPKRVSYFDSQPWPFIAQRVASLTGVAPEVVRAGLAIVAEESRELEPRTRDREIWETADRLLGATTVEMLVRALGLAAVGTATVTAESLEASRGVLRDLSGVASRLGLRGARKELRQAALRVAQRDFSLAPLCAPLREMFGHLERAAGTGASFSDCPLRYYAPAIGQSWWWSQLTSPKLRAVLDAAGARQGGRVVLRCLNAINQQPSEGEPNLVSDTVALEASERTGGVPSGISFLRRIDGGAETPLGQGVLGRLDDPAVPAHSRPVVYKAEGPTYRSAAVNVLSLSSFRCGGYVRILGAVRAGPINPDPIGGRFLQEVTLARAGIHQVEIVAASGRTATLVLPDGSAEAVVGSPSVNRVDLQDRDGVEVIFSNTDGSEEATFALTALVEEYNEESPHSQFEALVRAHQKKRQRTTPPVAPDRRAGQLAAEFLRSEESWRGVVACWGSERESRFDIDWAVAAVGSVPVTNDVRPPLSLAIPPASYIARREAVRAYLIDQARPISEIDLSQAPFASLVAEYLAEFLEWLRRSPQTAIWTDCVALYAARSDSQAGGYVSSSDPVALLLSPLHPLRLAWHSLAQGLMASALSARPCPAAGLLDPHAAPGVLAIPLYQGDRLLEWRAFLAARSDDPYWSVLWSRDHAGNSDEKRGAVEVLSWLGIRPTGLTGAPTSSQALRSLNEVDRILSARATLRVGLAGGGEEAASCVDGVIDWCIDRFASDTEPRFSFPATCEVFDLRESAVYPSDAILAHLADLTGERVRWFKKGAGPLSARMDLVVLDQVSALDPRATQADPASTRSAIAAGALFRVNIRRDYDARLIRESRVGTHVARPTGLALPLGTAVEAAEALAINDSGIAHLQFQPNQAAIGRRLEQALFLAATSAQIDPACFIRGVGAQGGYLWDYELPSLLGIGEDRGGYYLIARPPESLRRAVENTAALVTASPPPAEELLDEISRRGIPVLKRMANGGTHARGELGALLAVRYLQDAFRAPNSGVRLPVIGGECLHFLLPVDSYWEVLRQFQSGLYASPSERHPDLLLFAIRIADDNVIEVKVTPIEVKFRESIMPDADLSDGLAQASNLGELLAEMWETRFADDDLWGLTGRALLAQCLDQCFRVYADPELHGLDPDRWTQLHERTIHSVVGARATMAVARKGRLIVCDRRVATQLRDVDSDGELDTLALGRADAECVLTGRGGLSAEGERAVAALRLTLSGCGTVSGSPGERQPEAASRSRTDSTPTIQERPSAGSEPGESAPPGTSGPTTEGPGREVPSETSEMTATEAPVRSRSPVFMGWTEPTRRWAIVGRLHGTPDYVALDLDHPKAIGIFGYMGSGKSYLLGTLVEAALTHIPGVNSLPSPLAVVVFNYRRNASDRFELTSLAVPNDAPQDVERLRLEYGAGPRRLEDLHVLCLPGELSPSRRAEYGDMVPSELYFAPHSLTVEDWELLMGEPGSEAVFARTIRHTLVELRSAGAVTLEDLESHVMARLTGQSRNAAQLRFDFVRRYVSPARGIDFGEILRPGRAVVIDLRQPLFNKEDALRFFLVCANQISRVQGQFNKLIVFDEAHEYLSSEFGERMEARIRQMRHEGTSYVFATQDVGSIPLNVRRFITTRFVFDLGTRENIDDLLRFAPEFRSVELLGLRPGHCLVQALQSSNRIFEHPAEVEVRPRVTQHGGASRIY